MITHFFMQKERRRERGLNTVFIIFRDAMCRLHYQPYYQRSPFPLPFANIFLFWFLVTWLVAKWWFRFSFDMTHPCCTHSHRQHQHHHQTTHIFLLKIHQKKFILLVLLISLDVFFAYRLTPSKRRTLKGKGKN